MTLTLPVIDVGAWRTADATTRGQIAAACDEGLRTSGFLLLANHGISASVRADIRSAATTFFRLETREKQAYSTHVGGRGWIPPGGEANAYYGEVVDPARADLKESWTSGRDILTGDPAIDAAWFPPNVWPAETPELPALCAQFTTPTRALFLDLLEICAVALHLPQDSFTRHAPAGPFTFNINRYPPLTQTGTPLDGQFRIAAHTDWGIITILDRQAGYGGLQVETRAGDWENAPFVDDTLTVNIGDLLALWSGNRWRSTRHRVLPPSPQAPDEELISLIMFFEVEPQTAIAPFDADASAGVIAGTWLAERASAASVQV